MANSRSSKYESKATTTKISATSRISKKIEETFYTLEFTEERIVPEDADMEQERKILWDVVNAEVDNQIEDILNMYKK